MAQKQMRKPKAGDSIADINVTPMVDVMLVMLIIFMVITPMLSKGVSVDLVRTANAIPMANADKEDAILVAVTRDGKVFMGSAQTAAADLPGKIRDILSNRLDKTCYVKADSRARYEKVVEVVDNLRASGVDNIGLITELDAKAKPRSDAPAAPVAN